MTVIEFAPRLIPREDDDVSQAVADFLKEEGIDVCVNSKVVGVEKQVNSIVAKVETAGEISPIAGTHLLVATGRRPNTDDLGLDKAGVETDARGYIRVDDQLRTNISGIWAMGDCNGRGAFTHTSWNDFEIVTANCRQRSETSERSHHGLRALHRSATWPRRNDGSGRPQDGQVRADLDHGDERRHARV